MRFSDSRGHKDKGAPSFKLAFQSIAKLGYFTYTKRICIESWMARAYKI